jgi:4-amino-4-deoxy-L-arabinose transferase-like glycosyltransferase
MRFAGVAGGVLITGLLVLPADPVLDRILPRSEITTRYREQYRQGFLALKHAGAAALALLMLGPLLRRGGRPEPRHANCRLSPSRLLCEPGVWVLVALGAAIRWPGMSAPLQCDEIQSLEAYVTRKIPFLLTFYQDPNNQLFYNLLAHLTCGAFGVSPVTQRLPAFLFGVGSIAAVYLLARLFFKRRGALVTAGLTALSGVHVRYSEEARAYTLVVFGAALGTYLLALALHTRRARPWAAYGLVMTLSIWGHALAALVVLAHGATALAAAWRRRDGSRPWVLWSFALIAATVSVLYAVPSAFFAVAARTTGSTVLSWGHPDVYLSRLARDFGSPYGLPASLAWGWGALAIGGSLVLGRRRRWLFILLLLPFLLGLASSLGPANFSLARYHLYVLPFFMLSVTAALARLARGPGRYASGALAAALIVACAVSLAAYRRGGRSDDRTAGELVTERARPGDAVLIGYETTCGFHDYYLRPGLTATKVHASTASERLVGGERPRFVVVSRGGRAGYDAPPSMESLESVLELQYERLGRTGCVDTYEFYEHEVWIRR